MISVNEAEKLIAGSFDLKKTSLLNISKAAGMMLATDVKALCDVPSFNNSAMDGYAFRYNGENIFDLHGKVQAGDSGKITVLPHQAVRIYTGAPVPEYTDTVAQQEITVVENGKLQVDLSKLSRGANIRLRGSQCKAGEVIAHAGTILTPGTVALLASVGIDKVPVYAAPSVYVIITGNELQQAGIPLREGCIYNSNQPALCAFFKTMGIEETAFAHVTDSLQLLAETIKAALQKSDMLIITGGISVGDYDFVNQALAENGVQQLFYKVKQKPGKPFFAGYYDVASGIRKPVFALPGNPAAVLSCILRYVKPSIMQMKGIPDAWNGIQYLPLANSYSKKRGLTHFVKIKLKENHVWITGGQESFNLLPFADCSGIAELPEESEFFSEGTLVKTYLW